MDSTTNTYLLKYLILTYPIYIADLQCPYCARADTETSLQSLIFYF